MNVIRSSRQNLPYHVNDSGLDLKSLVDKNIIIVGERHGQWEDLSLVKHLIETMNPKFVLVEMLGDAVLSDMSDKRLFARYPVSKLYYGDMTKLWSNIALEHDVEFIGIEYTDLMGKPKAMRDDLVVSFKLRERHFMKMIDQYAKRGKVIVVVGDTHLRTIETVELGAISPLYLKYINDESSAIIRSQIGEIE